jgi:hypothetical protein
MLSKVCTRRTAHKIGERNFGLRTWQASVPCEQLFSRKAQAICIELEGETKGDSV